MIELNSDLIGSSTREFELEENAVAFLSSIYANAETAETTCTREVNEC